MIRNNFYIIITCNGQMRALSQRGSQCANEHIYIFIIHKRFTNYQSRTFRFSSHHQSNTLTIF